MSVEPSSLFFPPAGAAAVPAVSFPAIYAIVKQVVRANALAEETRATLKSWLKSNDTLMALLSLTVSPALEVSHGSHP